MNAAADFADFTALALSLGVLAALTARGQLSTRQFALITAGAVLAAAAGVLFAGGRHG